MLLIYLGFTSSVHIRVGSYIFVNLGYIEVARMSANKQFEAVGHCPVFAILGKHQKKSLVCQEIIA
jgi:hypothetical protein